MEILNQLKPMMFSEIKFSNTKRIKQMLENPVDVGVGEQLLGEARLITSDGEPVFICMSIPYFLKLVGASLPSGKLARIKGELYKQIL